MEDTDEPLPSTTTATNLTEHSIYDLPTLVEYYTHLTPFVTLSMMLSLCFFLLNISIFGTTVAKLYKILSKPLLRTTIGLCALYPLIAFVAFLTILLPKSWLVCHTIMHLSFTLGAILFRRLCFQYVDSEENYLKITDGNAVTINTPPCCCCCMCLPGVIPSKTKLCLLRYMVWQMPFVQGSVMLVLNYIYYTEPSLYYNVMFYFMPFIISSILFGIWSLNITMRMIGTLRPEFGLMKKMFALQLILLLCKLQYIILDSQLNALVLGGPYPINHQIYKQTFINLLILAEMVLVSLLAQNAYKVPVEVIPK